MRLFCREDHAESVDICPPHDFVAGWSKDRDGDGDPMQGVIFCTACGDVRLLLPPSLTAPLEEHVTADMER